MSIDEIALSGLLVQLASLVGMKAIVGRVILLFLPHRFM
jgi:hypothetical protein